MSQNTNEITNVNSDEISIKDVILKVRTWWKYILSKWVLILVISIIGGILDVAYGWSKKPIYKAELTFTVQGEKGSSMGGALGLASQMGIDVGGAGGDGGEFSGENLLELMKSRSMVEKALLTTVTVENKQLTLAEYYINFNKIRATWKDNPELINMHFLPGADRTKFTLLQNSILGSFHKTLTGSNLIIDRLDKKSSIIALTVNSTNELFSKTFCEVLAKVVSDFYVQSKTKKEVTNVAILQSQYDSVRRVLSTHIMGAASSIDDNPFPNPALQVLKAPSQRRSIEVQTTTIILSELAKNLEMAKMSLLQETPLIQVIDRPILPLEEIKQSKIKNLVKGGFIAGFLIVFYLTIKRAFKRILEI